MNQLRIWEHYQNERPDLFAGSVVRLDFLFEHARRTVERTRPVVLNVGMGLGWLERRCVEAGWRTYSLDPSHRALARLAAGGVLPQAGAIEALPYRSGSIDLVFCSEVLEHLTDQQLHAGLSEMSRVLRAGGLLVGSVPYNEDLAAQTLMCPECGKVFQCWGHLQTFDRARLREILHRNGFTVERSGVRAFLDFRRAITVKNRVGMVLHWLLGRLGSPLGTPTLFFVASSTGRVRTT